MFHSTFSVRRKSLRGALLTSVMSVALLAAAPAQATCVAKINVDAAMSAATLVAKVAAAGVQITLGFTELIDALTRSANGVSKDEQNANNAESTIIDKRTAQQTASATGAARSEVAKDFVPSRAVCGIVSAQQRLGATQAHYDTLRTNLQKGNTDFSSNAPGSGSEKGQLQALNTVWTDRCSRYANPTTMALPATMAASCAGPSDATLRDLDIQPWKAFLDPISFKDTLHEQAAKDSVRMLTDVAPPDPVRGNALLRQDGKNLHVLRMRDVTRMNLARGVLEDSVALRSVAGGQTHSRLGRYLEMIMGQSYDPSTNSLNGVLPAVLAAEEPENAAYQTISARLAVQQALIFEIMRVTEQLVAVEATALAVKVERGRTGAMAGTPGSN